MNLKNMLAVLVFVKGVTELQRTNDPADAVISTRIVERDNTYDLKAELEVMATAEVEPGLPSLKRMNVFNETVLAYMDATDADGHYEKSWVYELQEDDETTPETDEGVSVVLKISSTRSSNR